MNVKNLENSQNQDKEIYVCVGRDTGLKGRIICAATHSTVSHSWIEYWSAVWGGRWVAHTTSRGVIKEYSKYVYKRYPIYKRYLCHFDIEEGLMDAREHIGRSDYDYGVIWNSFLYVILRITHWNWLYNIVTRNAAKISCSEFVALILKGAKISGTEDMDPELTTTGMIDEFMKESPLFELVEEHSANI